MRGILQIIDLHGIIDNIHLLGDMLKTVFKKSSTLILLVSMLISLSLAACQNNLEAGLPALNTSSMQVIIKPNPSMNLSRGTSSEFFKGYPAEIIYLREMSGKAHVVRIDSENDDAFKSTLEQLNNDPRIEYAEPDLKMEIQPSQ